MFKNQWHKSVGDSRWKSANYSRKQTVVSRCPSSPCMDWHITMNSIRTRTIYLNKGQWILCASITSCKIVWNITTNKYTGPEQSSNFSTVESDAHFLKWRAKFKKFLSLPRLSFLLKRKPQSTVIWFCVCLRNFIQEIDLKIAPNQKIINTSTSLSCLKNLHHIENGKYQLNKSREFTLKYFFWFFKISTGNAIDLHVLYKLIPSKTEWIGEFKLAVNQYFQSSL